ncbi:Fe-S cluster assembly sulfur transfer protein SufU [Coxiella endosymbiont of Amblyomma nuttalli]|uniref:Fe-S cluster assembly sulfur transfer protein SufU n=1 Tax=Coxiella endosymbiont of Amblyomma nuttalli TaxID=2749996 RepID=UPI001BA83701|nr:SUF system NifU family Fe-S cluster assembly protein [Coxiella endosymbiont of Amblyomma nuttalli]QTS83854.1 NifU-like protein [Coxiella endosymbiont of Amblyomma nuttalli]
MHDLRDLYQEIIIDHGRNPRNFAPLSAPTHTHEGYNPLCGDRLTVYFHEKDGVIKEACFEGSGCAISMASASLMMEMLKGKSIQEAENLFSQFHGLVTGKNSDTNRLGKLAVLAGVAEFPMRVKCATLCWHTTLAALRYKTKMTVRTE